MVEVENISEEENSLRKIEDLDVYASGTYPVEISKGKSISASKRVKLKASIDCETGKVSFYVDKDDIKKLKK